MPTSGDRSGEERTPISGSAKTVPKEQICVRSNDVAWRRQCVGHDFALLQIGAKHVPRQEIR